jgi:dTDP-glucose pyrophosphorylase
VAGGANRVCFVIGPGKSDIVEFYGGEVLGRPVCYAVQAQPAGLCDAVFRTLPFVAPEDRVLIGLPDTVWFPDEALNDLPWDRLALLLFPVEDPEHHDAVVTGSDGAVLDVQVQRAEPGRERRDQHLGTLFKAYIESGGDVAGIPAGEAYVDIGTIGGYRDALVLLHRLGETHCQ